MKPLDKRRVKARFRERRSRTRRQCARSRRDTTDDDIDCHNVTPMAGETDTINPGD